MLHTCSTPLRPVVFWCLLACILGLTSFAHAAQQPNLAFGGQAPFLNPNSQSLAERRAAKAIIAQYFEGPSDSGEGWLAGDIGEVAFETDGKQVLLPGWPNSMLVYKNKQLFEQRTLPGAQPQLKLLTSIEPTTEQDRPRVVVSFADIDFDGEPDYFVLESPSLTNSNGYSLLGWNRKAADGSPLVIPFGKKKLSRLPDGTENWLLFNEGYGPNPGFVRSEKILVFSGKNGPYYDSEHWCFDGTHYFMCAKLDVAYYTGADNLFVLTRLERFDAGGKSLGISWHEPGDAFGKEKLLFAAQKTIPLYAQPGERKNQKATLHKGQLASVLDVRLMEVQGDEPVMWYKLQVLGSTTQPAWGALRVEYAGPFPVPLLGVRLGPQGAEALVQAGKKQLVITSRPRAVYDQKRE